MPRRSWNDLAAAFSRAGPTLKGRRSRNCHTAAARSRHGPHAPADAAERALHARHRLAPRHRRRRGGVDHACAAGVVNLSPSVRREAVEQAGAAGAAQRVLAAAAVRAARRVRGVPGFRRLVVAKPHAVVVADHRGAGLS